MRTNEIIPSTPRGAKFREELLSKILPWDKITVSLHNLPSYYIQEHTKSLLVECVASNLKHNKLRMKRKYGSLLKSSSHRIMLQTVPGAELYRERLVSAVAREMKVPLLRLHLDPGKQDNDGKQDRLHLQHDYDYDYDYDYCYRDDRKQHGTQVPKFNKGDRVKYVGGPICFKEVNYRTLKRGQRWEVYEVNGEEVAVVFNICGLEADEAEKDDKNMGQALLTWLDERDVRQDLEVRIHDCHILMEVLYEVLLQSQQPVIVYFPDSFLWPPSSKCAGDQFYIKVESIFDQLQEGVVMICAENIKLEGLPVPLQKYIERLQDPRIYKESQLHKLFTNVFCIKPPMDEDLVHTFVKELEKHRLRVISEGNLKTMQKVLKDHSLSCMNLEHPDIEDEILTREKAEKIVGWAMNHHLSSCPLPCLDEETLCIPLESIKLAILRLKKEEKKKQSEDQSKNVQDLAIDSYEKQLVSAVVRSEDINVKFDDVGALEHVKKVLYETVILPMRRPELFSHGNLLKPCKGILLFGPPGTGKTLTAKALATESGANFINITASTITSQWVGETEKLTRALFSYASKLAPVIIFIDEVDSLLGARGHKEYHTSRLNEFMAAWDGLNSKDSDRILVVGATNRPYDLDEAVIRRMPRRIYVGLPDVENRSRILKILLNKENLESGFSFEKVAEATNGYSGSDLKNLCVAAAYRPLEDFIEQESKGGVPALRPLNLQDFVHSTG